MIRPITPESIESPHEGLLRVKERFVKADEHYEVVRAASERLVSRWVWATAPRYHLNPLYFYDRQLDVGRLSRTPPKDPGGWVAYGFSSQNRIVLEHDYLADLRGRRYEAFYRETEDCILSYFFHHDRSQGCINCAQLMFAGGMYPGRYLQWAIRGWAIHDFMTADGKIRSFTETFSQDDEPPRKLTGELRYPARDLVELWITWPGSRKPSLSYRGAPPAENPFLRLDTDLER